MSLKLHQSWRPEPSQWAQHLDHTYGRKLLWAVWGHLFTPHNQSLVWSCIYHSQLTFDWITYLWWDHISTFHSQDLVGSQISPLQPRFVGIPYSLITAMVWWDHIFNSHSQDFVGPCIYLQLLKKLFQRQVMGWKLGRFAKGMEVAREGSDTSQANPSS